MSATSATFRATFPEFSDTVKYPNATINFYLQLAYLVMPPARWGTLLDYGAQLYAAHNIAIEAKAQQEAAAGGIPGSTTGPTTSRSAGPVSYSTDVSVAAEQGAGYWNLTTYGMRIYRLIKLVGIGGIQLGVPYGYPYGGWFTVPTQVQIQDVVSFLNTPVLDAAEGQTIPPAPGTADGQLLEEC